MNLSDKINRYIEKAVHFGSAEEARQYGIKLPEEVKKPKFEGKKPEPKTPDVIKPKVKKKPDVVGEIGHQLSPKGPYRSPEDITEDIKESQRIADKIRSLSNKKKQE